MLPVEMITKLSALTLRDFIDAVPTIGSCDTLALSGDNNMNLGRPWKIVECNIFLTTFFHTYTFESISPRDTLHVNNLKAGKSDKRQMCSEHHVNQEKEKNQGNPSTERQVVFPVCFRFEYSICFI